jgi:hypothetical protein
MISVSERRRDARRDRRGVDTTVKNSWDITMAGSRSGSMPPPVERAMLEGLKRYLRRYPYTVLAPLWLRVKNASGGWRCCRNPVGLSDERPPRGAAHVPPRRDQYQKYIRPGRLSRWHCELHPQL